MPIDPTAVGAESDPFEREWTSKDALLYALGVGCGLEELEFTTDNSTGIDQKVLPTFATVIGSGSGSAATSRASAMQSIGTFNPAMLVHGEQALELHRPIPVEGKAKTVAKIIGIWDKGSGAVIQVESSSVEARSGEPMFTNVASVFIRGEGGFGGERGPSGPRNVPPEREPDKTVSYETLPEQALIYRLSGDHNPLHSDPEFAKMAGFDRPIMHGLCTYGFTGRALVHALCDSDVTRFVSIEGRFTNPAWPGDTLTIKIWVDGSEAIFRTETQQGDVVIDQGRFTFR